MNYITYNLFFLLAILPILLSMTKQFRNFKGILYLFSFIFVVVFSSVRYKVGPDYESYMLAVQSIIKWGYSPQIDYLFFSIISLFVSDNAYSFVYVFFVYFFITYFLLFSRWKNNFFLIYALIIYICFGFYFDSLDRIRQFLAISVFFYSYDFFIKKKYVSWLCFCVFGVFSHISFILVIPFYFVGFLKVNRFFLLLGLVFLIPLSYFGISSWIITTSLSYVPFYSDKYLGTMFNYGGGDIGFGFAFRFIMLTLPLFFVRNNLVFILLYTGALLYLLSSGNLLLNRFSSYFTIFVTLAFPEILYRLRSKLIEFLFIVVMLFFFQKDMQRNSFEYNTIFSSDFYEENKI